MASSRARLTGARRRRRGGHLGPESGRDHDQDKTVARLLPVLESAIGDRYRVGRVVGAGGTAVVFAAEDLRHHRAVAIKVLHPDLARSIGALRFVQEIEIAARLTHPHILPLLDSGSIRTDDGCECPFYVMPLVEGETLRQRLAAGPIPSDEAIRIVADVASAVDYAHRQGVVHRDIKPENVMFVEGLAVIADFGIAHALDEAGGERLTRTGILLGTPQYMSPEQITGEGHVDHRADVYALGCVLYEMLAGEIPFAADTVREALARRLAEPPPKVRGKSPSVSPSVEVAIERAMATEPEDRFGSVAEFVSALRATAPGRAASPLRGPAVVLGLPVAALAVLAAVWLFGGRPDAPRVRSLAIRPLVNTSQDSTTLYLSEGIHEAVADLLRGVPALGVTAPTLVSQILSDEPGLDLRAFGERVGAGAVLTWTLRRQRDSVRLRAELVSAADGRMMWGHTYDRAVGDVVTLPGDIVRTVTQSLGLELTGAGASRVAKMPTDDPAAYDAYLRGRRVWLKATPLGGAAARANADSILYYADRALQRDPGFAGAHFLRAAFYTVAAIRGWRTPFGAVMDTGLAAARRALVIDSTLADAHLLLGLQDFFVRDEWEAAGARFRHAVTLKPDLATAHFYYGIWLGEVERRHDSALSHLRRAVSLDVQSIYLNSLGDMLLRAGRLDSAAGVLRQAVALEPTATGQRSRLIRVLEELGRFDEAIAARREGPDSAGASRFAEAYASGGAEGYRRALRADLEAQAARLTAAATAPNPPLDTVPPILEHRIARLHARLGDWPSATEWILREYQRRPRRLIYVLGDPDFDGIRADPRFQALVRTAGLEDRLAVR